MPKKGYKQTAEHKREIKVSSLAHPERHQHFRGKKHTETTKTKMSISAQKRAKWGENSPLWEGGFTILRKQEEVAGRKKSKNCEICGRLGIICFDHNHKTGKFRGWICQRCNTALGMVEDNSEVLIKMIKYLN